MELQVHNIPIEITKFLKCNRNPFIDNTFVEKILKTDKTTDSDGDGLFDYYDSCPNVASTGYDNNLDGCLDDSDNDGVTDNLD